MSEQSGSVEIGGQPGYVTANTSTETAPAAVDRALALVEGVVAEIDAALDRTSQDGRDPAVGGARGVLGFCRDRLSAEAESLRVHYHG